MKHKDRAPSRNVHKLSSLALGSRFRYLGKPEVYVLLDFVGCGQVTLWEGANRAMSRNQVFSAVDAPEKFMHLRVEVADPWSIATPRRCR